MDYNYFDIIASIIILLLGLKGILNGFFKELFGLLGIVGGIFVASRLGNEVGQYLSDMIFKFENTSAINFTGFLVTLAVFWLFMILIGYIFKKLSKMSGLGAVDKLLGFVFGASKFFFIAAIIAHAAYNIKAVKSSIDSALDNSVLFPVLVKTGGFIMKIDTTEVSKSINETIEDGTDSIKEKINTSTKQIVDDTKEQIIKSIPEMPNNTKDK
jgi:membrane protein required for colicin V production